MQNRVLQSIDEVSVDGLLEQNRLAARLPDGRHRHVHGRVLGKFSPNDFNHREHIRRHEKVHREKPERRRGHEELAWTRMPYSDQ